jgi:3',5'-cyclic AMP phosphodiesterase CpdA
MYRLIAVFLTLACAPGIARADLEGLVFVDANANGRADPGEAPQPGVAVTNGRDLVLSDANGRYRLPERAEGFTAVTRPAGFACETWYRKGSGDFALVPSASPAEDFFFVHMSDAHVYPEIADFAEFSSQQAPWWMPDWIGAWLLLRFIDDASPDQSYDEIVEELRSAVAPYRDVADASGPTVFLEFRDEVGTPGSPLGDVEAQIREAFDEVAGLRPEFVIHTGDLVLEGNNATPEAMERWFPFYLDVSRATGLRFYETIGNNELTGTAREDFPRDDPRYGKYYFRSFMGPTHYSFERGRFHFAATDTHRPAPTEDDPRRWDFIAMEPDVRDWLDADLAAHSGKTLVVLNHEPFHIDPSWGFDEPYMSDDEGLFAKHGVAYSLAGHTHMNGFEERDGTTHITTGALSGLRWALPPALIRRGYRLFYARGERLYSAWKDTAQPLLGFVEPRGDPAIHPASKQATPAANLTPPFEVVAVAADARGPFASIALQRGGAEIPLERWGDYFVHARVESGTGALVLIATTASGETHRAELAISEAAGTSDAGD